MNKENTRKVVIGGKEYTAKVYDYKDPYIKRPVTRKPKVCTFSVYDSNNDNGFKIFVESKKGNDVLYITSIEKIVGDTTSSSIIRLSNGKELSDVYTVDVEVSDIIKKYMGHKSKLVKLLYVGSNTPVKI